jgi:hypothetical protein
MADRVLALQCVVALLALLASTAARADGAIYTDWPSSLTVEPRPAYQPSAQTDIAISLGVTDLGSTTIGILPFRRLPDALPAWGVQAQLGFDGINAAAVAGLGYRFDPRWLFHDAYGEEAARVDASTPAGRWLLHRHWIALLPAVTISDGVGVAVGDPHLISGDPSPSLQLLRVNLSWRLGVLVEAELTAAETWRRVQSGLPWSETPSASASLLVILPWLVGTRPYDAQYLSSGLQRGIAVGPIALVERCVQRDAPGTLCGSVLEEEALEGALEFRLAPGIRPRIEIGRRHAHRINPAGQDVDSDGLDLGVQLALGIP